MPWLSDGSRIRVRGRRLWDRLRGRRTGDLSWDEIVEFLSGGKP